MPSGNSRGGAKRGCGSFIATQNIQQFCELRGGHGKTNHVRRSMHI